ncbi:MPV17 isoform 5 [Pan troglodytes]|uniref:MPV17 isoform 5 n=3 Tax=Pan TaxID=9596 RepID=A0A6D2XVT9_PANTR|nr:MPV17 isoform 5 [Pan troglodytes]
MALWRAYQRALAAHPWKVQVLTADFWGGRQHCWPHASSYTCRPRPPGLKDMLPAPHSKKPLLAPLPSAHETQKPQKNIAVCHPHEVTRSRMMEFGGVKTERKCISLGNVL